MRRFLALIAVIVSPLALPAQTVDSVIAKYIAARGGLAKIKALQSERISGTLSFGPGEDGTFVVERERPMKLHTELTLSGQTLIRTYDGKSSGWVYNPFAGVPVVQPMSEKDISNIGEEADFEGPFVEYKKKGNQVEYVGKAELQGKPAYKLKVTNKNGDVRYFYFDANSGLLLESVVTTRDGDKDVLIETFFRDYRDVDGLKYPFLVESNSASPTQPQKITATNIEVNPHIDESRFEKPNPPTPADAPKPSQ